MSVHASETLLLAAGIAACAACGTLFAAGLAERRGDLVRSRRIARPAGFVGGGAVLLALAAAAGALLGRTPSVAWFVVGLASMISGSSCLLAGLARKPRPAAALSLVVLGLGLALAAALASGHLHFR